MKSLSKLQREETYQKYHSSLPCTDCELVDFCAERCERLVKYEAEFIKQNPLPDFNTLWDQRHHKWVEGGMLCPVTKEIVQQAYTAHEIMGVFPDGEIRRVSSNSCAKCGDPNFTVGGILREVNEKRKLEAEQNV